MHMKRHPSAGTCREGVESCAFRIRRYPLKHTLDQNEALGGRGEGAMEMLFWITMAACIMILLPARPKLSTGSLSGSGRGGRW
jgi:hypothetical protein